MKYETNLQNEPPRTIEIFHNRKEKEHIALEAAFKALTTELSCGNDEIQEKMNQNFEIAMKSYIENEKIPLLGLKMLHVAADKALQAHKALMQVSNAKENAKSIPPATTERKIIKAKKRKAEAPELEPAKKPKNEKCVIQ